MKNRLLLLFVLATASILASAGELKACGDHNDVFHLLRFHSQYEPSHQHAASANHHCFQHDSSSAPCPEEEDENHCHCPGCISHATGHGGGLAQEMPFFLTALPADESLSKQAFYFFRQIPEEVHQPIWQPPKLHV
jgi:hypothetical protein